MTDWDRLPNFTADEFKCRCCGIEDMKWAMMEKLQAMRKAADFPFVITSGYRCPQHNANVSPATGLMGPHTTGHAVDIACRGKDARWIVVNHANFGFEGIGVAQRGANRFLHVDDLAGETRPWVWSY